MRWMIVRMIAAGSLSAFNTAMPAGPGLVRPQQGGLPAQPVRTAPVPVQQQPDTSMTMDKPGMPPAGRILPRGSLLNLSV